MNQKYIVRIRKPVILQHKAGQDLEFVNIAKIYQNIVILKKNVIFMKPKEKSFFFFLVILRIPTIFNSFYIYEFRYLFPLVTENHGFC